MVERYDQSPQPLVTSAASKSLLDPRSRPAHLYCLWGRLFFPTGTGVRSPETCSIGSLKVYCFRRAVCMVWKLPGEESRTCAPSSAARFPQAPGWVQVVKVPALWGLSWLGSSWCPRLADDTLPMTTVKCGSNTEILRPRRLRSIFFCLFANRESRPLCLVALLKTAFRI
jgi:hypothetical protein